ncbi:histidine phosphatase family protein [Gracilimonas tropica]|uniref:histidine phosphatase family protein n=1 Tax=Gracilimonas tropica TaxID=454600 RepID=UPI00037ACB52|nr:histidine phosphatase family protein [Gracilimonas tropica]
MKQIFIVRHGETDNNKAGIIQGRSLDASINELGRMQARAISEALEPFDIQKIVASGLRRTHETAQPLAEKRKLSIEKYSELDEINFGVLEGRSFTNIKDEVMELQKQWESGNLDFAPKNGESPRQTFTRANNKVRELLETSTEESIVFVIHGRLTRILLSEWLGYGLRNMHKIEHQNGAINHLSWHEGFFKAVELNMTDHLLELV